MPSEKTCTNCVSKEEKIQKIIAIEWAMFDCVNKGKGRASCQDDPDTFLIMRQTQFDAWCEELVDSYLSDLLIADAKGMNLIELKYLYMMCGFHLDEFMEQAHYPGKENRVLTKKIMNIMTAWSEQVMQEFPSLQLYSRPLSSMADYKGAISIETYQRCELLTYSRDTLRLFYDYVLELQENKLNLPFMILRNTALMQQTAAKNQKE